MTKQRLLALARKKYGKEAWVREDARAPDKETREIVRAELERHMARKPKAPPPTPEEIAYYAALKQWKEERDRLMGLKYRNRYEVGYRTEAGFGHIVGSGDTLPETARNAGLEA